MLEESSICENNNSDFICYPYPLYKMEDEARKLKLKPNQVRRIKEVHCNYVGNLCFEIRLRTLVGTFITNIHPYMCRIAYCKIAFLFHRNNNEMK
jgi:hypothetical protein